MLGFGHKKEKFRIAELKSQNETLEKEQRRLKEEVADLKLRKKIEDEDIKHMVKLRQESQEIEFKKKELDLEKKFQDAVAVVKNEYRDKTEAALEVQVTQMKGMYSEVLNRLPNIAVNLKGKVGD